MILVLKLSQYMLSTGSFFYKNLNAGLLVYWWTISITTNVRWSSWLKMALKWARFRDFSAGLFRPNLSPSLDPFFPHQLPGAFSGDGQRVKVWKFPMPRWARLGRLTIDCDQCDQIGRFLALWATIQSRWQKIFYPNCPHC